MAKRSNVKEGMKMMKRLKMPEDMIEAQSKPTIFILLVDPFVPETKTVSILYKVVINPTEIHIQNTDRAASMIEPVFTFRCKDNLYPTGMSFVNIGSKLYFMGGSISYSPFLLHTDFYSHMFCQPPYFDHYDLLCYPRDVYVFDCVSSKLLDSSSPYWIPPMISGKPENPIVFAVDNQIFVLSSSNGPQDMIHFETFQPLSKKWQQLSLPRADFFSEYMIAKGSMVMGRKLYVSYLSEYDHHLLWYDVDQASWTSCKSSYLPCITRDSVLVDDSLYSYDQKMILSLSASVAAAVGIIPPTTTTSIDGIPDYGMFRDLEKYAAVYPYDIQGWPNYESAFGFCTGRLFPIGGVYLGLVEFAAPPGVQHDYAHEAAIPPCELRLVVFEVIKGKPSKVIHACHFSTHLSPSCLLSGATCFFTS